MPQLFPVEVLQDSTFSWLPKVKVRSQIIYSSVVIFIILSIVALPLIKVDVSVKSAGLVRPVIEKNELRTLLAGTIEKVYAKDGDYVKKGMPILKLQEDIALSKLEQTSFDVSQREMFIHDLTILSRGGSAGLKTALYKQQYAQFNASLAEQRTLLQKLKTDYDMVYSLYRDKVLPYKDYIDKKYELNKADAAYQSLIQQQRSVWAESLNQYKQELNRLQEDKKQLTTDKEKNLVVAPVSGTLQGLAGKFAGGTLQAGELIGSISPDANLVLECYVSPKDIGYIKPGMKVKCQVDAFNYNEWGILDAKVISVDNDFTMANDQPVFKVKCSLDQTYLQLSNGVKGNLKKGMTVQARFILTKRSLYQLIYDRADEWMNPNTGKAAS